jgi:branched-subunit amino acid aminotransferase/4-amino-4-deoxychorismate lyase
VNASWLWTPGGFARCDSVPISDRGFRYGMSIFESLPLVRKTPIFLGKHLDRLMHACAERNFNVDRSAFTKIESLLRGVEFDGFARICVTAGDGPPAGESTHPRILVHVEERARPDEDAYERGYAVGFCAETFRPLFGGMKTSNYWRHIESLREAGRHGHDENLLLSERGELISACMANVFVVEGNQFKTPAIECGARNGVVRSWVLDNRQVEQCVIRQRDMDNADGFFLTNSWLGIMPASSLADRRMPGNLLISALRAEYAAELNKLIERG